MTTPEILERITALRALVVGDVCLDRWCRYDPELSEPSRETGIPRIAVVNTETTPGAAGTVANNLISLGAAQVAVLGVIGDDGFGFELERALAARGIASELCVRTPEISTFTYTKLINAATDAEDRPRVDFVNAQPVGEAVEESMVDRLRQAWSQFDVVLVSDQAETAAGGVITARMRDTIAELAASEPDKIVWADSRMRAELFRNVVLKCNEDEAVAACQRAFGALNYEMLRRLTRSRLLVITHGPRGAMYLRPGEVKWVRTREVESPVDICGAGDSFSAGSALALAITGSPADALRFGNLVSSVTIMKKGTGSASPAEVLEADQALAR
jgi:rfaE bifunctional protein kinase chain/domain